MDKLKRRGRHKHSSWFHLHEPESDCYQRHLTNFKHDFANMYCKKLQWPNITEVFQPSQNIMVSSASWDFPYCKKNSIPTALKFICILTFEFIKQYHYRQVELQITSLSYVDNLLVAHERATYYIQKECTIFNEKCLTLFFVLTNKIV